jgi:hypothetical protein
LANAADAILEARSVLPEVIEGDADDYVEVSEPIGKDTISEQADPAPAVEKETSPVEESGEVAH